MSDTGRTMFFVIASQLEPAADALLPYLMLVPGDVLMAREEINEYISERFAAYMEGQIMLSDEAHRGTVACVIGFGEVEQDGGYRFIQVIPKTWEPFVIARAQREGWHVIE